MTVNEKRFITMVTNKPLGKEASTEAGAPSETGEPPSRASPPRENFPEGMSLGDVFLPSGPSGEQPRWGSLPENSPGSPAAAGGGIIPEGRSPSPGPAP